MIIKHAHIEKFRALENIDFDLGTKLTAIVGHNGTMKTTVLGILSQTFALTDKSHPLYGEKTIDGYNYRSQFGEKFKLSEKDIPGTHKWKLDLHPNIYKNDLFEVHSIEREKGDLIPRFWSTEGKVKGAGYPQVPVYYLSLKRILPIGEEDEFDILSNLTPEEKEFIILEYREILNPLDENEYNVDNVKSNNKITTSIHNKEHDALSISAGQDNLGKILTAILSFKRLKDKYPTDYKGGIFLIDEIESTFHPLAQKRLIERLYKYASLYKIQFIFTTHSQSVIESAFFDKHNIRESKLVYLKAGGDKVSNILDANITDVINELSGKVSLREEPYSKIQVFCEDDVALQFIKSMLSKYSKRLDYSSCSIGAESYLELLRVKLPQLTNGIVILDGDKNNIDIIHKIKKYKASNVIFLPTLYCPEEMFYRFLYNLKSDDPFWDNYLGGYDKTKCFSSYPNLITRNSSSQLYKDWYNNQIPYFGKRACSKLLNYWKIVDSDNHEEFLNNFIKCFNTIAKKNNINSIE